MTTIEIKKSTVTLYKSLGKTTEEMAQKFGIKTKEMQEVLAKFGLVKARKPKESGDYTINLIDDVQELEKDFEVIAEEPTATTAE